MLKHFITFLRFACQFFGFCLSNITKQLGWKEGKSLNNFAPGKKLGGNIFENRNNLLPTKANRVWYEADVGVDYTMKRSNIKNPGYRILYSNDGLIYGTFNHYKTFFYICTY